MSVYAVRDVAEGTFHITMDDPRLMQKSKRDQTFTDDDDSKTFFNNVIFHSLHL
jgi:hypothetical protein